MFIEIGFTGELRSIGAPYGLCRSISHLTARGFQTLTPAINILLLRSEAAAPEYVYVFKASAHKDRYEIMNSQTTAQTDPHKIELRLRTMRILWIALLLSIVMYYVYTLVVGRPESAATNDTIFLVSVAVGFVTIILSFIIKNKAVANAAAQQKVELVQPGYIVAWALCELSALLGMLVFLATSNRYYYGLFILGAVAQLVHFPRREHLLNASFKPQ